MQYLDEVSRCSVSYKKHPPREVEGPRPSHASRSPMEIPEVPVTVRLTFASRDTHTPPSLTRWLTSTSEDLLPGDLFSLRRSKRNDTVPCDCLLVRGSAVLNEATLTGESVPQMKEGLAASKDADEVCLSLSLSVRSWGHRSYKNLTVFGRVNSHVAK